MSTVTWVILIGALAVLVIAALAGSRSTGSPAKRLGAWAIERNHREIIVSEVGIVVGAVLFVFGIVLESGFLVLLGLVVEAAALLRLVIHHGPFAGEAH